jgi:pimeloyl-ACP methyl ester carboxylesterase
MSKPALRFAQSSGVEIAAWEWPGIEPAILFAHATGFHGRAWDEVGRHFPGRRRISVEIRGHGRSAKPEPPYAWIDFGRDIVAIAESLGVTGAIGVGHSMGGHSTVCAALLRPVTYTRLLLTDPTIFPPELYGTTPFDATYILKRKNSFQSWKEMQERFRSRLPFSRWHPAVLSDYCEFGLLPREGELILACPPPIEASIYRESKSPATNIYEEIPRVTQPVTVVRSGKTRRPGEFDLSTSPTAANLASYFAHGTDKVFEDCTHYIPQEAPERVAQEIELLLVE